MYHRFMEQGKDFYLNHNGKIRRVVPKETLLEFNVKQGWGPLCELTEVPHQNTPRTKTREFTPKYLTSNN
jgi:hypothetical protein